MDVAVGRLIQRGSPFELADTVIDGVPCKVFCKGPKTLSDIYAKAESFLQRVMLVSGQTRLTYEDVLSRSSVLAMRLERRFGVHKGVRVAIVVGNQPEWIFVFVALTSLGATAVVLDCHAAAADIAWMCSCSECALVLTDENLVRELQSHLKGCQLVDITDMNFLMTADSLPPVSGELDSDAPSRPRRHRGTDHGPDDEALIAFTSGTTGRPKGVILTQRNLITGLMNMMLGGALDSVRSKQDRVRAGATAGVGGGPCTLVLAPLSHVGGYAQVILAFYIAGKIVLLPQWDPDRALAMIAAEKVRSVNGGSPSMIRGLIRSVNGPVAMASVASIFVNGVTVDDPFAAEIMATLPRVTIGTGYGMTETCGSVCSASYSDRAEMRRSSGLVLPSVEIKITRDDGALATAGELGEIWIRGAMVMRGYCAPTKDDARTLLEGWLRTNDRGMLDTDGNLYLSNRLSEGIPSGDSRIDRADVERSIQRLQGIDDVAACGFIHETMGEQLAIAVVLNPGMNMDRAKVTEEIQSLPVCAGFPARVVFFDELPRTTSGKVHMGALRDHLMRRFFDT